MTPITPADNADTICRKLAAEASEDYDSLDELRKGHWTMAMFTYLRLTYDYPLEKGDTDG